MHLYLRVLDMPNLLQCIVVRDFTPAIYTHLLQDFLSQKISCYLAILPTMKTCNIAYNLSVFMTLHCLWLSN